MDNWTICQTYPNQWFWWVWFQKIVWTTLHPVSYTHLDVYKRQVLLPLSKGGQLYAETFSQAIKKLPEDYQTMVDSKSWREDDLLDKIRQEEQMIAYLDEVNQSLSSLTMDSEEKGRLRRSNVELMRGHHANKRVYETILGDLRAYDSYSGCLLYTSRCV